MADDVVCRRRGSGGADGHHREPGPGPVRQPGPRPRAAVAGSRAGVAPLLASLNLLLENGDIIVLVSL